MSLNRSRSGRSIRQTLVLGMGATLFVVLALTLVVVGALVRTIGDLEREARVGQDLVATAADVRAAILVQESDTLEYTISKHEHALEALEASRAAEMDAYTRLGALAAGDQALAATIAQVRDRSTAWHVGWVEPLVASVDPTSAPVTEAAIEKGETLFDPALGALDELLVVVDQRAAGAITQMRSTVDQLTMVILPLGAFACIAVAMLCAWLIRSISGPLHRLDATAKALVAGEDVTFTAERDDEIGSLARVLEQLRLDAAQRYRSARREAERAATYNRLAELTSFAQTEPDLVDAAVRALRRLASTPRGHVMLLNNSTNRLIVAAGWGEGAPDVGALATLDRIDRCPGIRRATAYVADDLADDMSVRCPAHPAESGSVVCLPMPALGSIVGVIHLERPVAGSFDGETVQAAARIAEQAALAIANARLMQTMEGLAMTDPLTGLRNARFFDQFLAQEMAAAERDRQSVGLIMLDVDHFKKFNDSHGHPAGDEALKVLSRVLRSVLRTSDVVARYGGEEFVVALHHATLDETRLVAEKIRAAVEQTVVDIGPGRYARITVSLGIAATDAHHVDAKGLVSLADAALYQAKERGRNRVDGAPSSDTELAVAATRRLAARPARRTSRASLNAVGREAG